jgi:hypothetical protein
VRRLRLCDRQGEQEGRQLRLPGAAKGSCENRLLVRRSLGRTGDSRGRAARIADSESLRYVFEKVEAEVGKMLATAPESIRMKQAELDSVQRRIANFVDFVAQGRGSKALAEALVLAERKADELTGELEALTRAQQPEVRLPPLIWVTERVARLQEVLEKRTERSALLLRKLLGRIRLEPVKPDSGRFRAVSTLQPLALLEMDLSTGSEDGSNPLRWWRRRESVFQPVLSPRKLAEMLKRQKRRTIQTL